jgi:hypothetical protein
MAWRHCAVVSEPIAQHTLGYFATTLPELFDTMCFNRQIEHERSGFLGFIQLTTDGDTLSRYCFGTENPRVGRQNIFRLSASPLTLRDLSISPARKASSPGMATVTDVADPGRFFRKDRPK